MENKLEKLDLDSLPDEIIKAIEEVTNDSFKWNKHAPGFFNSDMDYLDLKKFEINIYQEPEPIGDEWGIYNTKEKMDEEWITKIKKILENK